MRARHLLPVAVLLAMAQTGSAAQLYRRGLQEVIKPTTVVIEATVRSQSVTEDKDASRLTLKIESPAALHGPVDFALDVFRHEFVVPEGQGTVLLDDSGLEFGLKTGERYLFLGEPGQQRGDGFRFFRAEQLVRKAEVLQRCEEVDLASGQSNLDVVVREWQERGLPDARRRNIAAAIWKQPPISPGSFDFLVEQGMKDPDSEQIVVAAVMHKDIPVETLGKIYAHYRPLRVLKDPASAILFNLARAPLTPEEILLELRSDENPSYSGEADANLKRRFPRDPTVSNWATRMPPFLKVTPLVIKGPGGDALSSDHLVEVVRCGDRGDAFWYQRRIVFVDPAGGAITLVDTSTEDFEIRDLRWDGSRVWYAVCPLNEGGHLQPLFKNPMAWKVGTKPLAPGWVASWEPATRTTARWGLTEGLPVGPLPAGRESGCRMKLCPAGGLTFVIGAERAPGAAPRGWIAAIAPNDPRVKAVVADSGAGRHTGHWRDFVGDRLSDFLPGPVARVRMGDGAEDVRVLVAPDRDTRDGRTMLINPATLEVSILGVTLPEEERVHEIRASGEHFVTRVRSAVKYYSTRDFRLVKEIDGLQPIAGWFSSGGVTFAYGAVLYAVDDQAMQINEIAPDMMKLKPRLVMMVESRNHGVLAWDENGGFNRVQILDAARP